MFKFKNKDTVGVLLVTSSTLTFIGNGMHFIALSWLILDLTHNPLSVGLLTIFSTLPGMIVSPITGVIADRFNKKSIAILMDLLRCLLVMSIFFLLSMNMESKWYLYIITILITISSNLFFPALSGVIKNTVKQENYLKVMSANSTGLQFGVIIGSGIAGYLISLTSISIVFFIDGLTYLLSALLLLQVKFTKTSTKDKDITSKNSFKREFIDGFNYVFFHKKLVLLFFIGAFPHILSQLINSLLAFYTNKTLKLDVESYGILDSSYAVGSVIMGLFLISYIKNKLSLEQIISYSFFFMAIGALLIAISNSLYISIIGLGIIGASILSETTSSKTLFLSIVEENFIGRAESLSWAIYSSIPPLIGLFSTYIVTKISVNIVFLVCATLLFIMCVYSNLKLTRGTANTEKVSGSV
ncbi:DHA3 family macrolide efflux protein-like MFS transporter [Bacillus atrophaeus]|nr:MFS transporter [Bacillus atrophaeus]MDQ0926453.1 DHA3 family macrolide efflux protein-like MFS transporter [Bacillus atrophaeus]